MKSIKVRMELQLQAGDMCSFQQAVAEALQAHAVQLAANDAAPLMSLIEVPRGQLAYMVEINGASKAQEPDDGN